jgi:hypothetical protein
MRIDIDIGYLLLSRRSRRGRVICLEVAQGPYLEGWRI